MKDSWGCVILSGGRGSRMGNTDKSGLSYEGRTFLQRTKEQLEVFQVPCYLSRASYRTAEAEDGFQVIEDTVQGADGEWIGPMGGIWSCFENVQEDCLFFVSCDMPMFRTLMAERLLKHMEPGADAVLWRTRDGRLQPMCALYSRSCLKVLKQHMDQQNYRMMKFLGSIRCVIVDTASEHIPDTWFMNVNTPEVYERLTNKRQPVLAVSGSKNTGKTWLLEQLVTVLSAAGIRTAVIKHDGHEFEADVPGTDSYRMKQAGAYGTVVYSGSQFSLVKEQTGLEAKDFLACFPEADLILLEGQKNSSWPKIEVLRREISQDPVCRPDTVLFYVADCDVNVADGAINGAMDCTVNGAVNGDTADAKRVLRFEQTEEIAELVIQFMDQME